MAKKRKESKGRKKRQETGAPEGEPASADDHPPEDPEDVDAVIDLDEDLDDPLARADLIAAVAEMESAGDVGADDPSTLDGSDAPDDESAPPVDEVPSADEEVPPEDEAEAADDETRAAPLIGADALVALSEFRREGVATLPEELILDLGDSTTPEERDRLLAAALAHVEMQDAIYRVPLESPGRRRWKGLVATGIFLMALVVVGLPPGFLVPDAAPSLTVSERNEGLRLALLVQAAQIEAFRARSGRLPSSIDEVETALPGIRFVRSSNRLYQLIAYTPAGDAVVYDSASPDPSFTAAQEAWTRLSGGS